MAKRKRQMPPDIPDTPEDVAKSLFSTPPMTQADLKKRIQEQEKEKAEAKEQSENA